MKITKNLGYAIHWLSATKLSAEQIATELDLSTSQVTKFLSKSSETTELATDTPIKTRPIKSSDLMIRHTNSKNINTVAIMTKEASQINDASRKNINEGVKKYNSDCIFRPKDKKNTK